jgi:hypothetical protein
MFQGQKGKITNSTIAEFLEVYFPYIISGIVEQMLGEDEEGFTKVKGKKKGSEAAQAYESWINCSDLNQQHLSARETNSKISKSSKKKNSFAILSEESREPEMMMFTEPDSNRDIDELLYSFGEWSRVERRRFDTFIREEIPVRSADALDTCCKEFDELSKKMMSLTESTYQAVLSSAKIIGATTTGAAKMRHLLSQVRPSIVIVEEAGFIHIR